MATLVEELDVSRTYIKVKFLRTIRVTTLTNSHFTLTKGDATPVAVTNPFRPIEISEDYYALSRILTLFFNDTLEANSTYTFTITNLQDASGSIIPTESYNFLTGDDVEPTEYDVQDTPDTPQVIEVDDHSVTNGNGNGSSGGNGSGTSGDLSLDDTVPYVISEPFYVVATDPPEDEPLVTPDYNNGRVTIKFNKNPAASFINTTYFKGQRRKLQREFTRWETLPVRIAASGTHPWVYVDFPSTDDAHLYNTASKEYFPPEYKYRVRVSRDVDAATATSSAGGGTKLDLVVYQGTTFSRTLTYLQGSGEPLNLTDYTARMQIRPSVSGAVVLELTTENGGIVVDGPAGKLTIMISAEQSSALTITSGVYDVEVVSPGATPIVSRILSGKVTISPEVTR